jgi:hypothetical protein
VRQAAGLQGTPIASLQVSCDNRADTPEVSTRNMSYSGPQAPLRPYYQPLEAYTRVFGTIMPGGATPGNLAAAGPIDELRAASSRRHLEIEVEGSNAGWLDGRSDLTVVERRGDLVKLLVADNVDLAGVLAAASAAGPVRRFAFQPPTLSELFMEVVR